MGEYRIFVLDTYIIITTLILTSKVLRWGWPEAAVGGGSGTRSAGKAREHGVVKGEAGLVPGGGGAIVIIIYYHKNI